MEYLFVWLRYSSEYSEVPGLAFKILDENLKVKEPLIVSTFGAYATMCRALRQQLERDPSSMLLFSGFKISDFYAPQFKDLVKLTERELYSKEQKELLEKLGVTKDRVASLEQLQEIQSHE